MTPETTDVIFAVREEYIGHTSSVDTQTHIQHEELNDNHNTVTNRLERSEMKSRI